MALYKYVTADRVDVVRSCRIRFSPIEALNDPFECLNSTRIIDDPEWFAKHVELLIDRLDCEEAFAAAKTGRRRKLSRSQIRTLVSEQHPQLRERMKDAAFDALHDGRSCYRLLCFSRVPADDERALLLWSHYTESHKGMVLEFDENHPWITGHTWTLGGPHEMGAVVYDTTRPGWNKLPNGELEPAHGFIFRKAKVWEYENEFRLLRLAGSPGVHVVDGVDALVNFPPECLLRVTFGKNASPETKEAVRAAKRARLPHLALMQATIDRDEYKVNLAPDRSAAT